MTGQRLPDGEPPWPPANGSYWRMPRREGTQELAWYVMTPNGLFGCLVNHVVAEHEDGTITVSPSILTTAHDGSYHGYLERGVWRNADSP